MPIPSPHSGEKEQEFISRCISQIQGEYGNDQAAAICYSKYKKSKIMKSLINETIKLIKIGGK